MEKCLSCLVLSLSFLFAGAQHAVGQIPPTENTKFRCGTECNCPITHNTLGLAGANQFNIGNRWTNTASDIGGVLQGDPVVVTWSIIPDGADAQIGPSVTPSTLIATFDTDLNEPNAGTPDITNRFWFSLIERSFDRWSELSGVEFVYEPNDDGVANFTAPGVLGVRGDIRIGGFELLVAAVAISTLPNGSDQAVDTLVQIFSNPNNDFRLFKNVFGHEIGHGLGIAHVESNNANFLLDPFISGAFDGPQLDDIRAAHRQYGDFFEKANDFQGNDNFANAIDLGIAKTNQPISIGNDGATGTVVADGDIDFVSIDGTSDADYFSFTLMGTSDVEVVLSPVGASYNQSPEGGDGGIPLNTSSLSDLTLALFDSSENVIQVVNNGGLGVSESISGATLPPGDYTVRVTGAQDIIQLYSLDVDVVSLSKNSVAVDLASANLFDDQAVQGNGLAAANIDVFDGTIFAGAPVGVFGTPLYVRERGNENQPQQEVRADVIFDVSGVTAPLQCALLEFTAYTLNDVTDFSIGRIVTGDAGFDRELADVISGLEMFAGSRAIATYSIDVTSIVAIWMQDPTTNLGLRIQLDDNVNDGMGIYEATATEINDGNGGFLPIPADYIPIRLSLDLDLLLGDVNGDAVVDLLDVGPFVELILGGGFNSAADINGDGIVDLLDVSLFVEIILG